MRKRIGFIITLFIAILAISTNSHATDVSTQEDLKSQLKAKGEATVRLTNDIVSQGWVQSVGTKTLDLNGHTLTLKGKYILIYGELTVTGNGTITTDESSTVLGANPGSTVTIENGTISTTRNNGIVLSVWGADNDNGTKTKITIGKETTLIGTTGIAIYNDRTSCYGVEVNVNGTIKNTDGGIGVTINGNVIRTTGNVPIININEGAKITSSDEGVPVYAAGYGIYNINGGELEGSEAVSIKSGIINISGGKLTAEGEYKVPKPEGNAPENTGSAISITNNDDYAGKIAVNFTKKNKPLITSKKGYALLEATTNGTGEQIESINIEGGQFIGEKGSISIEHKEKLGKFITAGNFNTDVIEFVKDTSIEFIRKELFYVRPWHAIIVSEAQNGKVEVSKTKAAKWQTVELNVIPDEGYELDTLKVLDEDGKEIEISDLKFVMPFSKVTVNATFKVKREEQTTEPTESTGTTSSTTPATPNEGEKDDTPKTGLIDAVIYISVAVTVLTLISIKFIKRKNK